MLLAGPCATLMSLKMSKKVNLMNSASQLPEKTKYCQHDENGEVDEQIDFVRMT